MKTAPRTAYLSFSLKGRKEGTVHDPGGMTHTALAFRIRERRLCQADRSIQEAQERDPAMDGAWKGGFGYCLLAWRKTDRWLALPPLLPFPSVNLNLMHCHCCCCCSSINILAVCFTEGTKKYYTFSGRCDAMRSRVCVYGCVCYTIFVINRARWSGV